LNIFGFEIKRKRSDDILPSVVTPSDDGAVAITAGNMAGYYAYSLEMEGKAKTEYDLIRRYLEIAQYPDCDTAIDEICNEAIVVEDDEKIITLNLDDIKISDQIKKKINEEFDNILHLLDFRNKGHEIFRMWYIVGRMYYNIIVDPENPKNGINELRRIDPRKIRKVNVVKKKKTEGGVDLVVNIDSHFIFNDKGLNDTTEGIKLPTDSVLYSSSGVIDYNTGMTLSYLHKAVKIVNQLKMMEDSAVIYRITRSPERRVFYIDTGNLPKLKAEQYVSDIMNKFRNKIVYDSTTGEIKTNRNHLSTVEDYFMARRDGGKGTEIQTLPGLQNPNAIEDIEYFQNKLFQALNVPMSRLKGENGFSLGRATEISRDEIKFNKFIQRIRNRFSTIFLDALRIQLILKGIINSEEWDEIEKNIRFDYNRDNYFSELKDSEIIRDRLSILEAVDPFVGKYFSMEWVKKNILQMNDEEIEKTDKEMFDDRKDELELANHRGEVQVASMKPVSEFEQEMQLNQMKEQEQIEMQTQFEMMQKQNEMQQQNQEEIEQEEQNEQEQNQPVKQQMANRRPSASSSRLSQYLNQ
jgi:hypothetical protein